MIVQHDEDSLVRRGTEPSFTGPEPVLDIAASPEENLPVLAQFTRLIPFEKIHPWTFAGENFETTGIEQTRAAWLIYRTLLFKTPSSEAQTLGGLVPTIPGG